MSDTINSSRTHSSKSGLASQFSRFGWIGFWLQVALLVIPILILFYALFIRDRTTASAAGIDLYNYLSYGGLLVLVFTTFWFYRYTLLGGDIANGKQTLLHADVVQIVWIGIWASCAGIAFSMLLLIQTVGRMLFTLLATPQVGILVAPSAGGDPAFSVSAADALSLTMVVIVLAAELIVLGLSLWLLYRTLKAAGDFDKMTA
ncbi:MAG: DUF3611 family protein [Hyphomicrobiaceae bacterium]